jgi:isovaleryl-CoA dehydrogenase
MTFILPEKIKSLQSIAQKATDEIIGPKAKDVDEKSEWPKHSFDALKSAGLMGLHVPRNLGGHEQGLLALAALTETIGMGCASSAICYGMHCVGTAVITAKATPYHQEHFLKPIAQGKHITTLSLSEHGTGSHFYFPQTQLNQNEGNYVITGTKQFITNGSFADSYVISTTISKGTKSDVGEFNCLILENDTKGLKWLSPWRGFGMRGNSSLGLELKNIEVSKENLLGNEGDQTWFVFEVVAPYFLIAMAGTYLGVAQEAFNIAASHLKTRTFSHSGESLADVQVLQVKIAQMWTEVQKTRALIYEAGRAGDQGESEALLFILNAKADAAETAVNICNEAMTICGGSAYKENSKLAQLLRDARASHVMAPTTDILRTFAGKTILGLPIL